MFAECWKCKKQAVDVVFLLCGGLVCCVNVLLCKKCYQVGVTLLCLHMDGVEGFRSWTNCLVNSTCGILISGVCHPAQRSEVRNIQLHYCFCCFSVQASNSHQNVCSDQTRHERLGSGTLYGLL